MKSRSKTARPGAAPARSRATEKAPLEKAATEQDVAGDAEVAEQFLWEVVSINMYLEEIQYMLAKHVGISGPQWMILIGINDLDQSDGVSVRAVSNKLHLDPSFVTAQTKVLEKHGLLRRRPSENDARVVLMSLTDRALKQLSLLSPRQELLNSLIFSDLDLKAREELNGRLSLIRKRLEKAVLRFAAES
jgi:DNA-binding MarR family transcriptional regulator